jgi:hypothetical protein
MALNQNRYHFGSESGTESTYPVLAAANFPIMHPPGRGLLCRVNAQASGGVAHANTAFQWRYRHTPKATGVAGAWTDITTSSAVARTGSTTVFTNGANCTQRLAGTGTFEASGAGCTHDGSSGGAANDIAANGCSETAIGIQIINADTAVGDLVELRVESGGTPLAGYDAVPTIRVAANILAIQSRDTSEQVSVSAAVARIVGTQVCLGVVGLSASDLADSALAFSFTVWGTTVVGSTDPADYTIPISGPDGFTCGTTGKAGTKYAGMNIPPEYCFVADVPEGTRRVLARVTASKPVTWGLDAAVTGDV